MQNWRYFFDPELLQDEFGWGNPYGGLNNITPAFLLRQSNAKKHLHLC
jgi:hypothetical protein